MNFPAYHIVVLPNDTPVAAFDAMVVNLDVIIACALHIGDQFQHKVTFATDVAVIDATTGEVVWNYRDNVADGWQADNETWEEWEEEEEDDAEWEEVEEDDDDLEIGFDPYLGCYTDDC